MIRKIFLTTLVFFGFLSTYAQTDTTTNGLAPMPMPPSAMAGSSPMPMPGMTGPLKANPRPIGYNTGFLGTVYITGVASGIGQWQSNVFSGDKEFQSDVSNGQVFIQKIDGVIQYFLQIGGYSFPDLGVPYFKSGTITNATYGMFPQGFLKIVPSKNFSVQAGKLPTLVGAEYTFSFENMNVQRGLLWNQENAVNRGVQANYTAGPVTLAVSWNDGLYSKKYTWAWLSAVYAINSTNSLAFIGGGNTKHTDISTSATPLYLNNEQIYNLIYIHTSGKWTIEPYLQYTKVPKSPKISTTQDAETYGAAFFINYAFPSKVADAGFNLPVRLEYIKSKGSAMDGAPNLLYGQGSNAWSFTLTPTYQYKRFFGRTEFSFVKANDITSGAAFGPNGISSTQARLLLEIGMLF